MSRNVFYKHSAPPALRN